MAREKADSTVDERPAATANVTGHGHGIGDDGLTYEVHLLLKLHTCLGPNFQIPVFPLNFNILFKLVL